MNVHLTYYDTAYGRFEEWAPLLARLGVRYIRDGLVVGDPRYVNKLRRLAATGTRASLIVGEVSRPAAVSVALAAGPLRKAVATLEGPNEPDQGPSALWERGLLEFMVKLREAVDKQLGKTVPLLGPSFVSASSRGGVGDIAGLWDIENIHPYPGGESPEPPPDPPGGERPVMATETGYHNALRAQEGQPPVSEEAAAAYIPRVLVENFAAGIKRTFLYELIDEKPDAALLDPEQHFGLLRQDLSPKPAFNALRNLLGTVVHSPGKGPHRDVVIGTGAEDVQRLLLERDDGSRVLLLWRRVPVWDTVRRQPVPQSSISVPLRFSGQASAIEVSYPTRAPQATKLPDATRMRIRVGGDVAAVSFR